MVKPVSTQNEVLEKYRNRTNVKVKGNKTVVLVSFPRDRRQVETESDLIFIFNRDSKCASVTERVIRSRQSSAEWYSKLLKYSLKQKKKLKGGLCLEVVIHWEYIDITVYNPKFHKA